jgi:hypothetical protein
MGTSPQGKVAVVTEAVIGGAIAGGLKAQSNAIGTPTDTTQLYRAVGTGEAQSIAQTGTFSPSPTGSTVKGFFFNEGDAQSFSNMATKAFGDPHSVVSTEAPTDLVNSSAPHSAAGEGPGVYIRNEDLSQLRPPRKLDRD